jgi:hypothetical protein
MYLHNYVINLNICKFFFLLEICSNILNIFVDFANHNFVKEKTNFKQLKTVSEYRENVVTKFILHIKNIETIFYLFCCGRKIKQFLVLDIISIKKCNN